MEECSLWLREAEQFVLIVNAVSFICEDSVRRRNEGERKREDSDGESHIEV